jgi:hypothetical protein
MSEKNKIMQLRVPLKGEMKTRFLKLKDRFGFESNTDLIRLLITEKYDELKKEGILEK